MKRIKVGSDFSGVGAFNQALQRLGVDYEEVFACDMDKYARQTFIHNYGEPGYYPENVYDREIPTESLDIFMTSPPCQAFSLAGKRKGEDDKRGILFYNSHEFIKVNNPRYFIFENVKGLLSDDNGNTFAKWVQYLGGKSVNGLPTLFKHDESVDYHIYWKVLNAKNYGIPQNRERVFIVGIRDDEDNTFSFPKEEFLTKRLRDVLESDVDEKYYLSDKMVSYLTNNQHKRALPFIDDKKEVSNCIVSVYHKTPTDWQYLKVKSATKKGYETAKIGEDSINLEHPNSETRRGRVGDKIAQTLTTSCNQGIAEVIKFEIADYRSDEGLRIRKDCISPCITSSIKDDEWKPNKGTRNAPITSNGCRIRKLTPRECFRLMDFPESFDFSVVSDSQAYKQAGNSICVGVLSKIIEKLKL